MNKHVLRATVAAVALSTVSLAGYVAMEPAYAAQRGRTAAAAAPEEKLPPLRASVGKPLNEAVKLAGEKKFAEAMHEVQEADMVDKKTPYEEYKVAFFLGYLAINAMPQDLPTATVAYNRMVASGGAPEAEKVAMYDTAMRLNLAAMDYPKAIQAATELKKLNPMSEAQQVLATAYYQTNDFVNAAAAAKEMVDETIASGKKPEAPVLALLLNSQVKTNQDFKPTLFMLATVSTDPEVWNLVMQSTFEDVTKRNPSDHHLLNLYRLSMRAGTIKDGDYDAMASIDLKNGLPAEGKAVLTKANKTGELLTQANTLLANDQGALPALAAEAAKTTANGEIDIKLGESYWSYGRFDEAVASLQKGVEKGGLKDLADAQTTLGIALFDAGKKDEALKLFQAAAMSNSAAAPVANAWSLFVQRSSAAA
jgi:tetratricopeptide (TPR) repeat protein